MKYRWHRCNRGPQELIKILFGEQTSVLSLLFLTLWQGGANARQISPKERQKDPTELSELALYLNKTVISHSPPVIPERFG